VGHKTSPPQNSVKAPLIKVSLYFKGIFNCSFYLIQPNLILVNKRVYKGLISKKILTFYVEQVELLKREYPVEEYGKILQGSCIVVQI